jgi:polyisoprenoid-binding protein YceI
MNSSHRLRFFVLAVAFVVLMQSEWGQTQGPAAASAATRLEIVKGSKASYHVREQLARLNFPNDAVGSTESITGALVIGADGTFAPEASKITVDLRTLKTDEDRRDAFIRDNTLETNRHPMAEFVPRRQKGLPLPLPASGTVNFQLIGDMLLHGVTSEVIWDTAGTFAADTISVKATTRFNFAKFKITIPKVFGLLSVDDDIRLELDVRLRRAPAR